MTQEHPLEYMEDYYFGCVSLATQELIAREAKNPTSTKPIRPRRKSEAEKTHPGRRDGRK